MAIDNRFTVDEALAINDAVMHKTSGWPPNLSERSAEIVRRTHFSVQEINTAFRVARELVKAQL
jgi:hypothetical protein